MAEYVAFLRGINVGGHKPVPMAELATVFESLRFKNVRTLLASGNVLFEGPRTGAAALERMIERRLTKVFGHEIKVLIRAAKELQRLSALQPFRGIPSTPRTRFYVTFLSEQPERALRVPYESPGGDFKILGVSGREVCSVLTLSPHSRSVDLMNVLEKRFGRRVTTRNWQTIVRVLSALQE